MKTTDQILVIDIEATCWEEDGDYQRKHSEIIEIGVCLLDRKTRKIVKSESILVKPKFSKISEFCTKLTSITPEMVEEEAIDLDDACDILMRKYNSEDLTWGSYGNYDRSFLIEQCRKQRALYPMSEDHLNIKYLFQKHFNMNKGIGMERALKQLNITLEGHHHRGVDDAKNTAKILAKILT